MNTKPYYLNVTVPNEYQIFVSALYGGQLQE